MDDYRHHYTIVEQEYVLCSPWYAVFYNFLILHFIMPWEPLEYSFYSIGEFPVSFDIFTIIRVILRLCEQCLQQQQQQHKNMSRAARNTRHLIVSNLILHSTMQWEPLEYSSNSVECLPVSFGISISMRNYRSCANNGCNNNSTRTYSVTRRTNAAVSNHSRRPSAVAPF